MKFAASLRNTHDRRTLVLLVLASCSFWYSWQYRWYGLLPVSALFCISACCAKHNHTHRPTFKSQRLNRCLDLWLTLLTGSSTTSIRVAHQVRHHSQNQSTEDFVRCSLVSDMGPGKALLCYAPLVVRETWGLLSADFCEPKRRALRERLRSERLLLWSAILGLGWADSGAFLIAIVFPWLFAQWFLITMNLPQHDGLDERSAWHHSRNVVGNWSNWIFLNNGFHTAHHARPSLHWSDLATWHRQHTSVHQLESLNHSSLPAFWRAWWQQRKHQRRATS